MTKVELFELIRRDHFIKGESIRALARKYDVHRRLVRQAIADSTPPKRTYAKRHTPILLPHMREAVIDWLRQDRKAPRKQRHTARRVFQRLQAEFDFQGAESTIRQFVREQKRELGFIGQAFVPLVHHPGQEAEVDWYEAKVQFPWGLETVFFFTMRACFSGLEFHRAYPCTRQRAFLEAHALAFEFFGGVFDTIRYDNLKTAVVRIFKGRKRTETDLFKAMRSHYLFASEFCRPGIQGAHEKGGVEGGLGRFRRTHLVPVPQFDSFEALNDALVCWCLADAQRCITGRDHTINDDWELEKPHLRPLPSHRFDTDLVLSPRVDSKGRIRVLKNFYSVPIKLKGLTVEARVRPLYLECYHGGSCVAKHRRLAGQSQESLQLDHYLELLWYKPGVPRQFKPRLRDNYTLNIWLPIVLGVGIVHRPM